eukprot:PhF_6_TR20363/c0_g1_i1/m.29346
MKDASNVILAPNQFANEDLPVELIRKISPQYFTRNIIEKFEKFKRDEALLLLFEIRVGSNRIETVKTHPSKGDRCVCGNDIAGLDGYGHHGPLYYTTISANYVCEYHAAAFALPSSFVTSVLQVLTEEEPWVLNLSQWEHME